MGIKPLSIYFWRLKGVGGSSAAILLKFSLPITRETGLRVA